MKRFLSALTALLLCCSLAGCGTGNETHDYILGNIHKAAGFSQYVDYVQSDFWDPPGLMFLYTGENVLAVDSMPTGGGVEIVYEEAGGLEIQVIFDDPGDSLTYRRAPSPRELPD